MALGLDSAYLIANLVAEVGYGIYLVLFFLSIYVLIYRRSTDQPNMVFLVASIVLFALITTLLAISFSRELDAFVTYVDAPGGAIAELANATIPKVVAQQVIGLLTCLFLDSILIYRCWVVWSRNWLIVLFPLIMLGGSTATFIFITVEMTRMTMFTTSLVTAVNQGLQAFIILTLCQNIIVTGLIVWRLLSVSVRVSKYSNMRSLLPVVWILVESGSLYSATLIAFVVASFQNVLVQVIMSSMLNLVIGITFSSIIVRVGLAFKRPAVSGTNQSGDSFALAPASRGSVIRGNTEGTPISFASQSSLHAERSEAKAHHGLGEDSV